MLIFGLALSFGVSRVSSWFNAITRAQNVSRLVTSWILIGIGIYYVVIWFNLVDDNISQVIKMARKGRV